jgi:hypothetical protein
VLEFNNVGFLTWLGFHLRYFTAQCYILEDSYLHFEAITSWRMVVWEWHVARIKETVNALQLLVEKLERMMYLQRHSFRLEDIKMPIENSVTLNWYISVTHLRPAPYWIFPASYSGCPWFKFRLGDRLSWEFFRFFPQPLQANAGMVPWHKATTASFHNLSNSSFTYPFIRRYVV